MGREQREFHGSVYGTEQKGLLYSLLETAEALDPVIL